MVAIVFKKSGALSRADDLFAGLNIGTPAAESPAPEVTLSPSDATHADFPTVGTTVPVRPPQHMTSGNEPLEMNVVPKDQVEGFQALTPAQRVGIARASQHNDPTDFDTLPAQIVGRKRSITLPRDLLDGRSRGVTSLANLDEHVNPLLVQRVVLGDDGKPEIFGQHVLVHHVTPHITRNEQDGTLEWNAGKPDGLQLGVVPKSIAQANAALNARETAEKTYAVDESGAVHAHQMGADGAISPIKSEDRYSDWDIAPENLRDNGVVTTGGFAFHTGILTGGNMQLPDPLRSREGVRGRPVTFQRSVHVTPMLTEAQLPIQAEITDAERRESAERFKLILASPAEKIAIEKKIQNIKVEKQTLRNKLEKTRNIDQQSYGFRYIFPAQNEFGGFSMLPPVTDTASLGLQIRSTLTTERGYLARSLGILNDPTKKREYAGIATNATVQTGHGSSDFFGITSPRALIHTGVDANTGLNPGRISLPLANLSSVLPVVRMRFQGALHFVAPGTTVPAPVLAQADGRILDAPTGPRHARVSFSANGLPLFDVAGYALTDTQKGHSEVLTYLQRKYQNSLVDQRVIWTENDQARLVAEQKRFQERVVSDEAKGAIPGFNYTDDGPSIAYGVLSKIPIGTIDLKTDFEKQPLVFDPLTSWNSVEMVAFQPSAQETIAGRESAFYGVMDIRGIDPLVHGTDLGTGKQPRTKQQLSQETLAKTAFRVSVVGQGLAGFQFFIHTPDGKVVGHHLVAYTPERLDYGSSTEAPHVAGPVLTSIATKANHDLSEAVSTMSAFNDLYEYKTREVGQRVESVVKRAQEPFGIHHDIPLYEPVYEEKDGVWVEVPGASRQTYAFSYISSTIPNIQQDDPEAKRAGLRWFVPSSSLASSTGEGYIPLRTDSDGKPLPTEDTSAAWVRKVLSQNAKTGQVTSSWAVRGQRSGVRTVSGSNTHISHYTYVGPAVINAPVRRSGNENDDTATEKTRARKISELRYAQRRGSGLFASASYEIIPLIAYDYVVPGVEAQRGRAYPLPWHRALGKEIAQAIFEIIPSPDETLTEQQQHDIRQKIIEKMAQDFFFNEEDPRKKRTDAETDTAGDSSQGLKDRARNQEIYAAAQLINQGIDTQDFNRMIGEAKALGAQEQYKRQRRAVYGENSPKQWIGQTPIIPRTPVSRQILVGGYRLFRSDPQALKEVEFQGENMITLPINNNIHSGQSLSANTELFKREFLESLKSKHDIDPLFITSVKHDLDKGTTTCTLARSIVEYYKEAGISEEDAKQIATQANGFSVQQHELHPVLPSDFTPYDGYIEQKGEGFKRGFLASLSVKKPTRDQQGALDSKGQILQDILKYFHGVATKREVNDNSQGLLRKIGIPVDAQDSHYLFASMNPDHYEWATLSGKKTIDLSSPEYASALAILDEMPVKNDDGSPNIDAEGNKEHRHRLLETIKAIYQNPQAQEQAIVEWAKPKVSAAIDAFPNILQRVKDESESYSLPAQAGINVKSADGKRQETRLLSQIPWDDQEHKIIIKTRSGEEREYTAASYLSGLFGGKTIAFSGELSYEVEDPLTPGEKTSAPLTLYAFNPANLNKKIKETYADIATPEFMKKIGIHAMHEFASSYATFDENHPAVASLGYGGEGSKNPFTLLKKKINSFLISSDEEAKARLAGEIQSITQDFAAKQMKLVYDRIKFFQELSDEQKAMFISLKNQSINGNFNKITEAFPDFEVTESAQLQDARDAFEALAENDVFGNNMPNLLGIHGTNSDVNKITMDEHILNPEQFELVSTGKNSYVFARALEYPKIKDEVRDVIQIAMEALFDRKGITSSIEKLSNKQKQDLSETLSLDGDFSQKSIKTKLFSYLGISDDNVREGMLHQIMDRSTSAVSMEVAAQVSSLASHIHRSQEKRINGTSVEDLTPYAPHMRPMPTGLSPAFRAFVDHGLDKDDPFNGQYPTVFPSSLHPDEAFVPPTRPYKDEHEKMSVPYGDGIIPNATLFPLVASENLIAPKSSRHTITEWDQEVTNSVNASSIFANSFSARWSALRMFGQDTTDDEARDGSVTAIVKKYFGLDQEDTIQQAKDKIIAAIKEKNALNGLLLAANVGLGKEEDEDGLEIDPETKKARIVDGKPVAKKIKGSGKAYRIDGLSSKIGRMKATEGVYVRIDKDALINSDDPKSITITKGLSLIWYSRTSGNNSQFSVKKEIKNVPISISWDIENKRVNVNISDLRKKAEIFTRMIDKSQSGGQQAINDGLRTLERKQNRTEQEEDRLKKLRGQSFGIHADEVHREWMPLDSASVEAAITESNKRIGVKETTVAIPDLASHDAAIVQSFTAMFDSSASGKTQGGLADVGRIQNIEQATGWNIATEEQLRDAFKTEQFAGIYDPKNIGSQGIIVATIPSGKETGNTAIVFVPMLPAGSGLPDHVDAVDSSTALIEERLLHQIKNAQYARDIVRGVVNGTDIDGTNTADGHEEKVGDGFWQLGSRPKLGAETDDPMRLARPTPDTEDDQIKRTIGPSSKARGAIPRKTRSSIGKYVVISLDDSVIRENKQVGSFVSFKDPEKSNSNQATLEEIGRLENIVNRLVKKARKIGLNIDKVERCTKPAASMNDAEKLGNEYLNNLAALRSARSSISADDLKGQLDEEAIISLPSASIEAVWNTNMTTNHSTVAKMVPYLAFWLAQQSRHPKNSTSTKDVIEAILENPIVNEQTKEFLSGTLLQDPSGESKVKSVAIPSISLETGKHSEIIRLSDDGHRGIAFLDLPDHVLKIDPNVTNRKIGFSTSQMKQLLLTLPDQFQEIAEKAGLVVIAYNGKMSEISNAPLAKDFYTTRTSGNVIYASTLGPDPMKEFINAFADFLADQLFVKKINETTNIFGKNKTEARDSAIGYADKKIREVLAMQEKGELDNQPYGVQGWAKQILRLIGDDTPPEQGGVSSDDWRLKCLTVAKYLHREVVGALLYKSGSVDQVSGNASGKTDIVPVTNLPPSWMRGVPVPREHDSGTTNISDVLTSIRSGAYNAETGEFTAEAKATVPDAPSRENVVRLSESMIGAATAKIDGNMDEEQKSAIIHGLDDAQAQATQINTIKLKLAKLRSIPEKTQQQIDRMEALQVSLANEPEPSTGALVIIASAGSGKTTTISQRIAAIVSRGIAEPGQFFIASFTRRSADDLRDRINEVFELEKGSEVFTKSQVNTWHGLMRSFLSSKITDFMPEKILTAEVQRTNDQARPIDFLKKEIYVAGSGGAPGQVILEGQAYANGFELIDENDEATSASKIQAVMDIKRQVFENLNLPTRIGKDHPTRELGRTFDNDDPDSYLKYIFTEIEKIKSQGISSAELKRRMELRGKVTVEEQNLMNVYENYQSLMQNKGYMDHNDVLHASLSVLKNNPVILRILQRHFKQFFVDEFQDQNGVQAELLRLLAHKDNNGSGNVTVVGDEDQAIFGFRGSSAKYLEEFAGDYSARQGTLTTNYRSTHAIVEAGNALRGGNSKKMKAAANAPTGDPVRVITCDSPTHEMAFVVKQIQELQGNTQSEAIPSENSFSLGDIMIICRTNRETRMYTKYLNENGVNAIEIKSQIARRGQERNMSVFMGNNTIAKVETLIASKEESGSQHLFETADLLVLLKDAKKGLNSYGRNHERKTLSILSAIGKLMARNNMPISSRSNKRFYADFVEKWQRYLIGQDQQEKTRKQTKSTMGFLIENIDSFSSLTDQQKKLIKDIETISKKCTQNVESMLTAIMNPETSFFGKKLSQIANNSRKSRNYVIKEVREFLDLMQVTGVSPTEQKRNLENIRRNLVRIQQTREKNESSAYQAVPANTVQVITTHKVKGGEAPVVFLPNWTDGNVPSIQSRLAGSRARKEEAHLAYVGLTRAMEAAFITWAKKSASGPDGYSKEPSPYIDKLPKSVTEQYSYSDNGLSLTTKASAIKRSDVTERIVDRLASYLGVPASEIDKPGLAEKIIESLREIEAANAASEERPTSFFLGKNPWSSLRLMRPKDSAGSIHPRPRIITSPIANHIYSKAPDRQISEGATLIPFRAPVVGGDDDPLLELRDDYDDDPDHDPLLELGDDHGDDQDAPPDDDQDAPPLTRSFPQKHTSLKKSTQKKFLRSMHAFRGKILM